MNQQDKDRLRNFASILEQAQFANDMTPIILSLLEKNEALARKAARYEEVLTVLGMEDGEGDPASAIQKLQDRAALSTIDVLGQLGAMQHKGD